MEIRFKASDTTAAHAAWFLLHGTDQAGRKDGSGSDGLLHRTFLPDPDEFEFTVCDDRELGWVHVPTGDKIAGEFFVPALLPDGYLICTVNTNHCDEHPRGYVAGGVVMYGEEEKAAAMLEKNGVEIGGNGDWVAELLISIRDGSTNSLRQ